MSTSHQGDQTLKRLGKALRERLPPVVEPLPESMKAALVRLQTTEKPKEK